MDDSLKTRFAQLSTPWLRMRRYGLQLLAAFTTLGVTASAGARAPQSSASQVAAKVRHWFQTGQASWYGTAAQGRKTASGERFDRNGMTCAHRTLPLGSWLRVTNLRNSQSVLVRVTDRGPMSSGRIVDLSLAAARAVGLGDLGKVKLEAMNPSDPNLAAAIAARITGTFAAPSMVIRFR